MRKRNHALDLDSKQPGVLQVADFLAALPPAMSGLLLNIRTVL